MADKGTDNFIRLETLAGLILIGVLLIAILIANSNVAPLYYKLIHTPVFIGISNTIIKKPLLLWVNDGLMAIFFMLLAIEIKREFIEGELADKRNISLPFFCALGGIIVPILIYVSLNYSSPSALRGWPIPTTTDIAFVLGVISLLGKKVPTELKVLLVAFSIIDDIFAVTIIAIYYTEQLSFLSLAISLIGTIILIIGNKFRVYNISFYLILGLILWLFVLTSGVHATLAGIIVGLIIPIKTKTNISPGKDLEHTIHPLVTFFIIPLFVFINGGVSFDSFNLTNILHPVSLGIILGLTFGKGLGVFTFGAVAIKLKLASKSKNYNYRQFLGLCFLSGIGFTMSLFFAGLAFQANEFDLLARQGILIASLVSCIIGVMLLKKAN